MEKFFLMGNSEMEGRSIEGVTLYAPADFWKKGENHWRAKGYGCGPGKRGNWFIPDSFWFLNVWWPCAIHDHMYQNIWATTPLDKWIADIILISNLNAWIEAKTRFQPLRALRRYRAITYFTAVRDAGNKSFYKGKETMK